VAPAGVDVAVNEAVIYDSEEGWVGAAGDVVLAVGVDATRPSAVSIVDRAASAQAAALVVRAHDREALAGLLDAARAGGVAVLGAAPDIAWGHLHSLVRNALAATGVGEDQGGVPIGDLFALANAVAAQMGGPVTI